MPGTLNFDLDGAFINYLAWMIPWGTPVTLLGATTEQVQAAQRELVRVGIDGLAAQSVGGTAFWLEDGVPPKTIRRLSFRQLADEVGRIPEAVLLDTRQVLEWEEGHVDGAVFMPFYEVHDRMTELPRDVPVYAYCGSGYRASAVVSLLHQHGYENVVHVDDDFPNAVTAGLRIVTEQAPERQPGWTWIASRATARRAEALVDHASA